MYFIELLVKKLNKKRVEKDGFDPMKTEEREAENCEHVFMPIDSTGEVLACKNCGMIVNKKDLKDINFFKRR